MKPIATSNSRASRRVRAATLTVKPSATASADAVSTNQKWAGWFSH